jgi:YegS/Rv2252/BmrU family lipid kinase
VPAPVCLIVNPAAGGGKAGRVAPAVEAALRGRGLSVRRVDTRDLEHARELAAESAGNGETTVALSGDGMLGVLADALREIPGAVLGVLPGGRGNDLARVLGIPDDPVAACATIANGVVRPVDLGLVSDARSDAPAKAFVGIASVGFDSDANRIANEAPAWLGGLVYAYGALRALAAWRPARFAIELDPPGERKEFTAFTIGACNSKAYGGGMRAAPGALLDDGLLEVIVLESVSKFAFVTRILPKVFSGKHILEPGVRAFQAKEVSIDCERPFTMYADGDPIGQLPLRVCALRGAVMMLTPAEAPADTPFASAVPMTVAHNPEPCAGAPAASAGEHPTAS